jgi:hypothetical protein
MRERWDGRPLLNMSGSQNHDLVLSDREALGLERRKLGRRGAGSTQHDGCDCNRERVLHDSPPL